MLSIESARLKLLPLTHEQLLLFRADLPALENALGLQQSSMEYDDAFVTEVAHALDNFWLRDTKMYSDLYPWYTNWQIVLKSGKRIIGNAGFAGYPDEYGKTSVGYGISMPYRGMGYASEALQTLLHWGFSYSVLKSVKADTDRFNLASQRVLLKASFRLMHEDSGVLHYQKSKY